MRRLLGWLRERPSRFLPVLACVVALGVIGATVFGPDYSGVTYGPDGERVATPQTSSPDPGAGTPGRASSQSRPSARPSSDAHSTPKGAVRARTAALRYLGVFFDRTGSDAAWRDRLARYSTPTLRKLNATVPRSAVPHVQFRGATVDAAGAYYASVVVELSDRTRLQVALVRDVHGWLVTAADPAPPSPDVNG